MKWRISSSPRLRKQVFAKTDEKEAQDDYDCDYIVDEKARTVSLTASGIAKAEQYLRRGKPGGPGQHHHFTTTSTRP